MDQRLLNIVQSYHLLIYGAFSQDRFNMINNTLNRLILDLAGSRHIFAPDTIRAFGQIMDRKEYLDAEKLTEMANRLVRVMILEGNSYQSLRPIFRYMLPDKQTQRTIVRVSTDFQRRLNLIIDALSMYLHGLIPIDVQELIQMKDDFIVDIAGSGYLFDEETIHKFANVLRYREVNSIWINEIVRSLLHEGNTLGMLHELFPHFTVDAETRAMLDLPNVTEDLANLILEQM